MNTRNNARIITRRDFLGTGLAAVALAGCAGQQYAGDGWETVINGTSITGWSQIGYSGWSIVDGTVQGTGTTPAAAGYLISPQSYTDFELRAEFWATHDCNSGIFIRCTDRSKIDAVNAYEVNIFDQRPDPSYGTGAIVNVAKVDPMPKAGNRWNVYEITARGDHFVVVLNGQKTVDARDAKNKAGPIALQNGGGTVRFKRVDIRRLG